MTATIELGPDMSEQDDRRKRMFAMIDEMAIMPGAGVGLDLPPMPTEAHDPRLAIYGADVVAMMQMQESLRDSAHRAVA